MLIFSNAPGVVGAIITEQTLPFAVAVGGNGNIPAYPGYQYIKGVLTGFDIAQQSGLGVTHTLRDRIYVYMHGERAGSATITGIAFAGVCEPGASGNYTGFDGLYAYYERVRANTQGLPVKLVFGPQTTIKGFLTDLQFRLEEPQTGIGMFAMKFLTLPRNAGRFGYLPPLPWE